MKRDFRFYEESHTYMLDGARLPSVSEIISPLVDFSGVPLDVLQFAAERGKAVHKACELDDLEQLNYYELDPRLTPYVDAWQKFKRDFEPTFLFNEEPMFNELFGYAGTPDRVAQIGKKIWVPDIKSTALISRAAGVQLSGYARLVEGFAQVKVDGLMVVQLRDDGTYRTEEFKRDDATFLSCLNIHNWKRKNLK